MLGAIDLLREKFLERVERNPAYSLRALARDLGVSPAFISQVFSGKKKLSLTRAIQICNSLNLSEEESTKLYQAVALDGAQDPASRAFISNILNDSAAKQEFYSVDIERYKVLSQWYHLAILDLTTTKNFKPDLGWIAKRLKITTTQARAAVERLERLGLLEKTPKVWLKTKVKIEFPTDKSHSAVRAYHKQMIEKALDKLSDASAEAFEKRDITGTTIAIDPKRVPQAKKLIREFRQKFAELMSEGSCTEIYQLNVQFFNLTEGDSK